MGFIKFIILIATGIIYFFILVILNSNNLTTMFFMMIPPLFFSFAGTWGCFFPTDDDENLIDTGINENIIVVLVKLWLVYPIYVFLLFSTPFYVFFHIIIPFVKSLIILFPDSNNKNDIAIVIITFAPLFAICYYFFIKTDFLHIVTKYIYGVLFRLNNYNPVCFNVNESYQSNLKENEEVIYTGLELEELSDKEKYIKELIEKEEKITELETRLQAKRDQREKYINMMKDLKK